MQSSSSPLVAVYRVKRRKTEIKVTVKWALSDTCKSNERLDVRKRNTPEMQQEDDVTNNRRKSQKLVIEAYSGNTKEATSAESKLFDKNEMIFAWDEGQLYEAKVVQRKEDVNDIGKMKYYVHIPNRAWVCLVINQATNV